MRTDGTSKNIPRLPPSNIAITIKANAPSMPIRVAKSTNPPQNPICVRNLISIGIKKQQLRVKNFISVGVSALFSFHLAFLWQNMKIPIYEAQYCEII